MSEPPVGRAPEPSDEDPQLPPAIEQMLSSLTGGMPLPPELRQMITQSGLAPQMPSTKRLRIAWPCTVCVTSGWNCTP